MHAMAVDAYCYVGIALGEKLSVHAGFVLAQLIGSQGGVVLAHESTVGVATAAEFRNLGALDFATEAGFLAHSIEVRFRGISTVTTCAGQAFLRMDVLSKLFRGYLERWIEGAMAVKAGASRLRVSPTTADKKYREQ